MTGPAETVDVVVVGMGPGGESLAGELAAAGLSVVGVESRLVGGECPYYGCIPSKMLIRAAGTLAEARRVPGLAGQATVEPDFSVAARRIREEATDNWDDAVAAKRFTDKGGRLVRGTGRLSGPRQVTVAGNDGGESTFSARLAVVLNPGTNPAVPPIPGLAGTPLWTNREALRAEAAPESLIVLGGGPVGAELAQAFARFGTHVTVVARGPRLVPREEPEASELLADVFRREGIDVLLNTSTTSVSHSAAGFSVELATGPDSTGADDAGPAVARLAAEQLLVATGRSSTLGTLDLAAAGVAWDGKNAPALDGHLQVADGLHLIGDAAGAGAFTHMSMYHANIVAGKILAQHFGGPDRGTTDSRAVPRVTFTDPEMGAVGMTERQARDAGLHVRTGFTSLADSSRGWIHQARGFIKLVEDADSGTLVGAAAVGPSGGEVLSMLALAVHARVPVDTLRTMIYAYPTFHRAVESALADLH
ncbi:MULTISPECIES: NAD(P)/FAD-dependent oxidoreductase [unclassified Arthrobacter]|uniref:dihydrolipoyl dehydrogenase family protein n=1 Tax=unclassified Arthrobacter TaxID=235627 RepID=UPI00159E7246|nr:MULTISPECIES: FAD-dependent oxidoreductase [unclassified Arthrobacter]MCQ9165256.1 FAD-dependent oxidoreductase [Arthrobacter sp. STN4]NVM99548.1 FAD-dependent oxidoreductase [Arthrobacter sp. SDTb3-6]